MHEGAHALTGLESVLEDGLDSAPGLFALAVASRWRPAMVAAAAYLSLPAVTPVGVPAKRSVTSAAGRHEGLIQRSDASSQYVAFRYTKRLTPAGPVSKMSCERRSCSRHGADGTSLHSTGAPLTP